jgi:hypothetical protein
MEEKTGREERTRIADLRQLQNDVVVRSPPHDLQGSRAPREVSSGGVWLTFYNNSWHDGRRATHCRVKKIFKV